jgi:hypothetical protein
MCPFGTDSPSSTPLLIGEPVIIIFFACSGERCILHGDCRVAFQPCDILTWHVFLTLHVNCVHQLRVSTDEKAAVMDCHCILSSPFSGFLPSGFCLARGGKF